MRIQHLDAPAAIASLRSHPDGLAPDEAGRRLAEYGPNRIEEIHRESLIRRLLGQFTHFFALLLWAAAALALLAWLRDRHSGMETLAAAIVGVIVVNGVFSFWQEYQAERAIDALRGLLPREALALRGGTPEMVDVAVLVPGDIVVLEQGDIVPADCRLVEAHGARFDVSTITGESATVPRGAEPSVDDDAMRARNLALAGTSIVTGSARGLVYATGMRTEFGRIAHLTQTVAEPATPLQREIARLSRLISILSVGIGVACFALAGMLGLPLWGNLLFAIGVIVANVPEGLLPTVTLALAVAAQRMARRNALVRHLPSVETLGAASVICTDKTGTLTENRMTARRLWLSGATVDVASIDPAGLTRAERRLFDCARCCHDLRSVARNGRTEVRGDPMEVALVALGQLVSRDWRVPRLDEIPFDPDRRRLTALHRGEEGEVLHVKGAVESVLPLCGAVVDGGVERPLTPALREAAIAAQQAMATEGYRVLAFAHRAMPGATAIGDGERDLVLSGLVGLEDPPRADVADAVRRCREAGIRVIMITGDHPSTAVAIGRRIGLIRTAEPVVIRGDALRRMHDTQLQIALDAPEIVFARAEPDQKMRIVQTLQRKGAIVAVTGDGVNDAPALRAADVGVAMGMTGTEVAREAADIVLADDSFASIVAAIEEGRAVFANVRKFLTYILTSNVPELVPYLAFVLLRVPLALTIVQILAVDLGTDMLPALALGAEPPEPEAMRQPPRPPKEPLLRPALLLRAYGLLGVMEAAAAMAAFWFVLRTGGWQWGTMLDGRDPLYRSATAASLAAIVLMQVANVMICRGDGASVFARRPARNRLVSVGIATELLLTLAIVYTPWGNRLLGTAPFPATAWLVAVPFAVAMVGVDEVRKMVGRVAGPKATRASRLAPLRAAFRRS